MITRDRASWLTLALGFVLLVADIADLNVGGVAVLGFVCLAVGLWGIGAFTSEFWFGPDSGEDVSRLDLLDGVGVKPPVDLTKLTDEQLHEMRGHMLDAGFEAVGSDEFPGILANLDQMTAEFERRLEVNRKQAGWVWPKEEGNR